MADDSSLLIKINADAANVTAAYQNIMDQTEDLQGSLENIALAAGVAFAGLTAQVGLSVKAFAESDTASRQLSDSMQDQGIFTEDLKQKYLEYADQVSAVTGISKTQIVQAEGVAQSYLGQIPVTKELTQAIADLSVKQGVSLTEAATEMGKAIGNGTGALLRMGLQFTEGATEADRFQQTLDFVNVKAAGAATAISPIELALKKLSSATEESEVQLGSIFAPALTKIVDLLTSFMKPSSDAAGEMKIFEAALITAGLAVTGLATAIGIGVPVVIAMKAAITALNLDLTVTSALMKTLGIGLIIAGISIAIVELAEHWSQSMALIKAVVRDMGEFVSKTFSGIGTIIKGIATGDLETIKNGMSQIGQAFSMVGTDAKKAWNDAGVAAKAGVEVQDQAKKELADKLRAAGSKENGDAKALAAAQAQLIQLEISGASKERVDLKKKEIEELKTLQGNAGKDTIALTKSQIADTRKAEVEAAAQDAAQKKALDAIILKENSDHNGQIDAQNMKLSNDERNELAKSIETEQTAQKKVYEEQLKDQIKAHNTFLEEQVKYGTAYAAINQAMHSTEMTGAKSAFGDMAAFTQSSNATLKEIGKISTIANIVIKTAESAMNIYAGFSAIPIIGPELGIAGAAAAVAFGAEQIGNVTGAMAGGLVGGTGSGDTQPYMLEPGELVAPKQNFNEVVNSVAASRSGSFNQNAAGGSAAVELSFKGNIMDFIETKLIQRNNLNISNGALARP